MSNNLASNLASIVYSESRKAGDLFQSYLESGFDSSGFYAKAICLLSDISVTRFTVEFYCQSSSCEFTADFAQSLFSILDIAKKSLERIK